MSGDENPSGIKWYGKYLASNRVKTGMSGYHFYKKGGKYPKELIKINTSSRVNAA